MNNGLLPHMILRAASILAPADQRTEWLAGWRSEVWYVPRREAVRFCLGAFRDALWLRRNQAAPAKQTRLESPIDCLAFLAALAVVSSVITLCLPAPGSWTLSSHLKLRELPGGWMAMLILTSLILPATRLVMGPSPAAGRPVRWPGRLRNAAFLTLKIALVQPILFCGIMVALWILPVLPVAPNLFVCASWMVAFRWLLIDQRRRCPVCLRLLTNPVRIGAPSQTFLEWYGAESMCSRGHGLLQVPANEASYSGSDQWIKLDPSWSSLFVAGGRRR